MRTIIDLRDDQVAALDAHCRVEGISRAEALRRATDAYLREQKRAAARAAFGAWEGREIEGVEYTHRLREEWRERERSLRQRLPD